MALTQLAQAVRVIQNASKILIILPKHPSTDLLVAAIALEKILSSHKKENTLLCEEFLWPKKLAFLSSPKIKKRLEKSAYQISINLHDEKPRNISYVLQDKKLKIFIETEISLNKEDIELPSTQMNFDLIIFVGIRNTKEIEKLLETHEHLLSNIPILNIDCSPENEGVGHLHLTDITAPSLSELLLLLFEYLGTEFITEEIATLLLTGIIDQTRAFRTPNIPPKTLRTSSHLMKYGADREKIISSFYRTRTVSGLKLWGKILSRIEHNEQYHIAWSRIYQEDFIATQSTKEDLREIIDEIIMNIPKLSVVLFFYEDENKTYHGIMSVIHPLIFPKQLLPNISTGENRRNATFPIEAQTLLEAEMATIKTVKSNLEKIYNNE